MKHTKKRRYPQWVKDAMSKRRKGRPRAGNPANWKHNDATKKRLSVFWKGKRKAEEHPRWVHDRTKLARANQQRDDSAHHEWSKNIKCRDKWKCRIANNDCAGRLESHHILAWREHPELRYDLNNGITLCHFHHPRGGEEEKRLQAEFQLLVSASEAIL